MSIVSIFCLSTNSNNNKLRTLVSESHQLSNTNSDIVITPYPSRTWSRVIKNLWSGTRETTNIPFFFWELDVPFRFFSNTPISLWSTLVNLFLVLLFYKQYVGNFCLGTIRLILEFQLGFRLLCVKSIVVRDCLYTGLGGCVSI